MLFSWFLIYYIGVHIRIYVRISVHISLCERLYSYISYYEFYVLLRVINMSHKSESSLLGPCPNPIVKACVEVNHWLESQGNLDSQNITSPIVIKQYHNSVHHPITQATTIGSDYGTRLTYLRHTSLTVSQSVPIHPLSRQHFTNNQMLPSPRPQGSRAINTTRPKVNKHNDNNKKSTKDATINHIYSGLIFTKSTHAERLTWVLANPRVKTTPNQDHLGLD